MSPTFIGSLLQKRRHCHVQQYFIQQDCETLIAYFYVVVRMQKLAFAKSTVDALKVLKSMTCTTTSTTRVAGCNPSISPAPRQSVADSYPDNTHR